MQRIALSIGLWLCCLVAHAAAPDPFPQVASAYLVELNEETLWMRQGSQHLSPASLTKMMTVLLALEHGHLKTPVTISAEATRETGSVLRLKAGERFRAEDLLAASLLASANDACHALADHIAGNEAAFVERMNQRAQELRMHDTHFTNACGHDDDQHYSSAQDLLKLTHALLKHDTLLKLTAQRSKQIASFNGRSITLQNKNALIGRYDGALGIKTGYTPNAGKCLAAYVKRRKDVVILIMLHGQDRWWDAVDILDLAFDHARLAR